MSTARQVIQQPSLYVTNLKLAWASTTTLTVTSVNDLGQVRDQTNVTDIDLPNDVTINAALNGLNGLDEGSLAASTVYVIWAVGDSYLNNTPGYMYSLSYSDPKMPFGYDVKEIVGYWATDGSAHFLKGYVAGAGNVRDHVYDDMVSYLTNGTATSLTAVDLSTSVPAVDNTPVTFHGEYKPATAGDSVGIAAGGSTATVLPHINGTNTAAYSSGTIIQLAKLVSGVPKVSYINSAASGSTKLLVSGFRYYL